MICRFVVIFNTKQLDRHHDDDPFIVLTETKFRKTNGENTDLFSKNVSDRSKFFYKVKNLCFLDKGG